MKPLEELEEPTTMKALQRLLGMFAYYSKWISNFSDEAYELHKVTEFPLDQKQSEAF